MANVASSWQQTFLKKMASRLHSENWGGLVGLGGDALMLLGGDIQSVISALSFFSAEAFLVRIGHKAWGYSAGAAGFALGCAAIFFSHATAGNPLVHDLMGTLALTWSAGALRAPLEKLAEHMESPTLKKIADGIQRKVGMAALTQNMILFVSSGILATTSGSIKGWIIPAATALWTIGDVMVGRVQEYFHPPKQDSPLDLEKIITPIKEKSPYEGMDLTPQKTRSLPVAIKSASHPVAIGMQEAIASNRLPVRSLSLPISRQPGASKEEMEKGLTAPKGMY